MVFGLKDKETWKYCETDKHIVASGLFKRSVNYVINIEQLQSHPSFDLKCWFVHLNVKILTFLESWCNVHGAVFILQGWTTLLHIMWQ